MQKSFLLLLLIALQFSTYAQVNIQDRDSIIYRQLHKAGYRAERMAGTGATLALFGALTMATGVLIDKSNSDAVGPMTGAIVAEVGVCMFCVGVPLWIIEVSKMNTIEVEMIRYEQGYYQAAGVGLKLNF